MGDLFRLTTGPTRVTATGAQDVKEVPQVTAYKGFDLLLQVYELSGSTLELTVKVETSMQNLSDADGLWTTVLTSADVTASNKSVAFTSGSGRLLRYVRWAIELYAASAVAVGATFDITGMARSD